MEYLNGSIRFEPETDAGLASADMSFNGALHLLDEKKGELRTAADRAYQADAKMIVESSRFGYGLPIGQSCEAAELGYQLSRITSLRQNVASLAMETL